jgi:hypothetical protein
MREYERYATDGVHLGLFVRLPNYYFFFGHRPPRDGVELPEILITR